MLNLNLTDSQWKLKAREEIGDITRNHIFEIRLPLAASGGSWTAIFNGSSSTSIPFNSTGESVKSAFESIDIIQANQVRVHGIPKGPYLIEFLDTLGGINLTGYLTTLSDELIPQPSGVTVTTIQIGQASSYEDDVESMWNSLGSTHVPFSVRYLFIKKEIGKKRLGLLSGQVDTKDRDYEIKKSQQVAELRRIIMDAEKELASYQAHSDDAGSNAALGVKMQRRPYGVTELGDGTYFRR